MAQVYHIRTINGQVPPIPKSLTVARYTLDKDSYRNALGDLIRNPLENKKMKFMLEFVPMDKTEMQTLLTMLDSEQFVVTYEDIITGVVKSGNFYHGDIEVKPYWIKNEANTDVLYDAFSINLIEY